MAQVNETVLYQPDERPSHPASAAHGFQDVMAAMAAMAAAASIIAVAGGQSQGYLSWIFFASLVVCGIGRILQPFRLWRFGSGYSLSVVSGSAYIAICISALLAGGPALLSSLIVVSSLIQFVFISRLSWLRRVISPMVDGTVLMLLASTIITVVLSSLSDLPEGAPSMAAPILAGTTLSILMALRLFASPKLQQWAPVVGIIVGCIIAAPFGAYDWRHVMEASWIGIPSFTWPGFDLSFGATFWGILPGFVIVIMATTINSISDTVVIQQVAWRRPRATDFRVVQGAHHLLAFTNLLAAALGTLPTMIGAVQFRAGRAHRCRSAPHGDLWRFDSASGSVLSEAASAGCSHSTPRLGGIHCLYAVAPICTGDEDRLQGRSRRAKSRGGRSVFVDRHWFSEPGDSARSIDWHSGDTAQQRHDNRLGLRNFSHSADGVHLQDDAGG